MLQLASGATNVVADIRLLEAQFRTLSTSAVLPAVSVLDDVSDSSDEVSFLSCYDPCDLYVNEGYSQINEHLEVHFPCV